MTVIAWDGETLAADKRACVGTQLVTTRKIFRVGETLVGFSGASDRIGQYRAWLEDGRDPVTYPPQKENDTTFCLVIHRDGKIERFEDTPWPHVIEDPQAAMGSGSDIARGAMLLGCNALEAVAVTCRIDSGCGNGIDYLTFDGASGTTDGVALPEMRRS